MALYTIADLHLSTNDTVNKPMDVFGSRWTDYTAKICERWNAAVENDDIIVIPGDISWGMNIGEALPDFRLIDSLNGKKLIGKGNHDYWWTSVSRMKTELADGGVTTIDFLYNNAFLYGDKIIAGTRGWFYEDCKKMPEGADFKKLTAREVIRLGISLEAAEKLRKNGEEIIVFLHFPPVWKEFVFNEFIELFKKYDVKRVFYGHIHGVYNIPAVFLHEEIEFSVISADYLDFYPKLIG